MTNENDTIETNEGWGAKISAIADLMDTRVLSIFTLVAGLYVWTNGLPTWNPESVLLQYVKFTLIGGMFAAIPLLQIGTWVRDQLVTDVRDRLIELDEFGEISGKANVDTSDYDIILQKGDLANREPIASVPFDVYYCREILEVDDDNMEILVEGVNDWDDVDIPHPDQITADKNQMQRKFKEYRKEVSAIERVKNSMTAIKRRALSEATKKVAVKFERATSRSMDMDEIMGDVMEAYSEEEQADVDSDDVGKQVGDEGDEERVMQFRATPMTQTPSPDAGGDSDE